MHCNFRIEKLDGDKGYRVTYKTPDGPESTMDVGLVMMATGRKPKSKDIGLEVRVFRRDT